MTFLKDLTYSFSSNFLTTIISIIIVLVVPKLISVEQYGYYQLYTFYASYVGVSYLGWTDGINLRLGGKYYSSLDKSLYCTQFWMFFAYEVILFFVIAVIALNTASGANMRYTFICISVVGVVMCLRWFLVHLMQAVGMIKEAALSFISDRLIFVCLVTSLLLYGYRDFKLIVISDIIGKYISLLLCVYYCRELVFSKFKLSRAVLNDIWKNVSAGFKLMLAALCSMLIIGIVRFGVQQHWGIETFSRVSLTLSISNMVLTMINGISIVIYPMLRRTDDSRLPSIYNFIRTILMVLVFGGLTLYYPAQRLLTMWLPQYAVSLRYAAILLPVCAYECKMALLVNTYYKTLRMEKLLMKCNLAALALSIICTFIATIVLSSVTAAILSILFVLIFRCIIGEYFLAKNTPIRIGKDTAVEIAMSVAFIICNWYWGFAGMLVYAGCYALYLFIKKSEILETISFLKSMR